MNTTRIGKIARLPREVREVLGDRLAAGEPAGTLVNWLNGLASVQEVLQQYFGSRLITEQNLSEWRQGGHQDWLRREEARVLVGQLAEQGEDLGWAAQGQEISDRLARRLEVVMVRLAEVLVDGEVEPLEQWRRLREVNREVSRLRRDDHQAALVELHRQRLAFEVARANQQPYELPDRREGDMRIDPKTSQYSLDCLESFTQECRAGTDRERFVPVCEEEVVVEEENPTQSDCSSETEGENSKIQKSKFKEEPSSNDQMKSAAEVGEIRVNPGESDLSSGAGQGRDTKNGMNGKTEGGKTKIQRPKSKENPKSKDQAKSQAGSGQNQANPGESDLSSGGQKHGRDAKNGMNGTNDGERSKAKDQAEIGQIRPNPSESDL